MKTRAAVAVDGAARPPPYGAASLFLLPSHSENFGLVIAEARPDLTVVLVDRRAKRTDALEIAVAGLGWRDRVSVICADVASLTRDPGHVAHYDAVVSRGFGPHETTLRLSTELARPGGVVVLSEPPANTPNRWRPELLTEVGVDGPERLGPVARFTRRFP